MRLRRATVRQSDGLIRLKAADFGFSIHVSENWISNGHWVIRRSRVSNSILFSSREIAEAFMGQSHAPIWRDLTEEMANKLAAGAGRTPFTVTRLSQMWNKAACRLLMGEGVHAWVSDDILSLFHITEGKVLYGTDGTKQLSDAENLADATFVVMPMRMDDEPLINQISKLANSVREKAAGVAPEDDDAEAAGAYSTLPRERCSTAQMAPSNSQTRKTWRTPRLS